MLIKPESTVAKTQSIYLLQFSTPMKPQMNFIFPSLRDNFHSLQTKTAQSPPSTQATSSAHQPWGSPCNPHHLQLKV